VVFGHQEKADLRQPQLAGGPAIQSKEAQFIASLIKTAVKAEKDGFDAVVAVWGMRPGLGIEEARRYVRIPIVDFGQIALLLSHLIGKKLGRVFYTDELAEKH